MSGEETEIFTWPVRVYWEDTDAGGVVYHSRYLNFFERARSELLRARGIDQMELKETHGFIWVVTETNVKFSRAARLDDDGANLEAIDHHQVVQRTTLPGILFHSDALRRNGCNVFTSSAGPSSNTSTVGRPVDF